MFWTWHESGPYFGMPIQNLVGWSVTGLLYMGLSRPLWGSDIDVGRIAGTAWFPFTVYVANLGFAMALSLSAGLAGRARGAGGDAAGDPGDTAALATSLPPLGERTWHASPSR